MKRGRMKKQKEGTPGREKIAEAMDRTLEEMVLKRKEIEMEYSHIMTQLNKLLTHYKAVADERRMGNPLKDLQGFFKKVMEKKESITLALQAEEAERKEIPTPPAVTPLSLPKRVVRNVLRQIAWVFIRWHYGELKAHISNVAQDIQQHMELQSLRLQRWEELSSLQYEAQRLEVSLLSYIVKVTQQIADTQRDYDEYLIDLLKKLTPLVDIRDTETTYMLTKGSMEKLDIILEEFAKKQEHLHLLIIKQRKELDRILISIGNEETK